MANLRYWFSDHVLLDGNDYILVNIEHEKLCATGMIQVIGRDKLEGVFRTQGSSYKGAELQGLSFDMIRDSSGVEFVYRTLDRIAD